MSTIVFDILYPPSYLFKNTIIGLEEYDTEFQNKYDAIFAFVLDMDEMREMVDKIIQKRIFK
ncbi:hypothetical protein AB3U99_20415 [Niallia sp. JL1B1071]|uniref:hypothetical protein n=1 Tax=Niallia tiangongensis TaxID=3237105 RepID=UPI0037DCADA4